MSLNTQCPTCTTVFLVTSEALAVAGGWVRCGRCSSAFDAVAHPYTSPPFTRPVTASQVAVEDSGSQDATASEAPAPLRVGDWDNPRIERRIRRSQEKLNQTIVDVLADSEKEQTEASLDLDGQQATAQPVEQTTSHPAPDAEVTPITQAVAQSARPRFKGFLQVGLAFGLALLLGVQFVVAYRNTLIVHYPVLEPWVSSLCRQLGCQISGLRELDKVTIESIALHSLDAGDGGGKRYQLSWELSNQALYPVQAPALELSLNDALDRPVIRKVFHPSNLGLPDRAQLTPEGSWRGDIQLNVTEPAGSAKIAGYRVIAFYP